MKPLSQSILRTSSKSCLTFAWWPQEAGTPSPQTRQGRRRFAICVGTTPTYHAQQVSACPTTSPLNSVMTSRMPSNVHALPAGRSAKSISRHLTKSYLAKSFKDACMYADHFVPQLKHCWLRNVNKHTLKAGQGAPGMGHWLYTLPTAPFTKVANGPFKWGLQHRFGLASPGAGHLCGKELPGAKQPCKAPLDAIGRHVAWCARRAREIRHNRSEIFWWNMLKPPVP